MKIIIEWNTQELKEFLGNRDWSIPWVMECKEIEEENWIFKEDWRITLRYNWEEITIADSNYWWDDKYYTYDEAMELHLEWIHIPTIEEWQKLLKLWCEYKWYTMHGNSVYSDENNDKEIGKEFAEDFNIPFAGNRNYYDANVYGQGSVAYLWSSSPCSAHSNYARYLSLNSSNVSANNYVYRASGLSVRCFKNS